MHARIVFVAALSLIACGKPEGGASSAPSVAVTAPPAPSLAITGKPPASTVRKNFTVEATASACTSGATCTLTLRLSALEDFHINEQYPFKFSPTEAPGVTFLGKGEHKAEGEKVATMTVRFKPAAAGEANVSGVYKMSVCSPELCQLEVVSVQLAVPVL